MTTTTFTPQNLDFYASFPEHCKTVRKQILNLSKGELKTFIDLLENKMTMFVKQGDMNRITIGNEIIGFCIDAYNTK